MGYGDNDFGVFYNGVNECDFIRGELMFYL